MVERAVESQCDLSPVEQAAEIRRELTQADIAYGPEDDPRLWQVSPRYFVLRPSALERIGRSAQLLPRLIAAINEASPHESGITWRADIPYYFRIDVTVGQAGEVLATEFQNEVPVQDATVDVNRSIYERLVPKPRNTRNPFPGSIAAVTAAIELGWGSDARVGIVVPTNRLNYLRDYRKVAEMLRGRGIEAWVEDPKNLRVAEGQLQGEHGRIDLVYRAFRYRDFEDGRELPNGHLVESLYRRGRVDIFPQFSLALEDKGVISYLFDERADQIRATVGEEAYAELRSFFPHTWNCAPETTPSVDGRGLDWAGYLMDEEARRSGYVIKPRRSFGSKEIAVSRELSLPAWRKTLFNALLNGHQYGGFVLQDLIELQRFWVELPEYESNTMVRTGKEYGVRLSITCVVIDGETKIAEIDACMTRGWRMHGTRESILIPVVVKGNGQSNNI